MEVGIKNKQLIPDITTISCETRRKDRGYSHTSLLLVNALRSPKGESPLLITPEKGPKNREQWLNRLVRPNYEGFKLLRRLCYYAQCFNLFRNALRYQMVWCWKKRRRPDNQARWFPDQGHIKLYLRLIKKVPRRWYVLAYVSFNTKREYKSVKCRLAYPSWEHSQCRETWMQNKRKDFAIAAKARQKWNTDLKRISWRRYKDKTIFYAALYLRLYTHILQDVAEIPCYGRAKKVLNQHEAIDIRVFSLWDTYRNLHQLMTLLCQTSRYGSNHDQYVRWMRSWLPKWEVVWTMRTYDGRGDPSFCYRWLLVERTTKFMTSTKPIQQWKRYNYCWKHNPLRPNMWIHGEGYILRDSIIQCHMP